MKITCRLDDFTNILRGYRIDIDGKRFCFARDKKSAEWVINWLSQYAIRTRSDYLKRPLSEHMMFAASLLDAVDPFNRPPLCPRKECLPVPPFLENAATITRKLIAERAETNVLENVPRHAHLAHYTQGIKAAYLALANSALLPKEIAAMLVAVCDEELL